MSHFNARETILGRIRSALRDVPPGEDVPIPRDYHTRDDAERSELLDLFADRVADYKAIVHRLPALELEAKIQELCESRGMKSLVASLDFPAELLPSTLNVLRDENLDYDRLDAVDGVVTLSTLGIAQTGTIVLDGGEGQGRRAISLIPDYHLCVIHENQVVGSVPEAVAKLETSASAPGRPITFISGPSATSDIELNRVEGVHGPRTLEVLIVAEG